MISYPISLNSWPLNFCHSSLNAPTWTESYLENKLLSVPWKGCRIRLRLTRGSWADRCCRELERFNYIWCRSAIRALWPPLHHCLYVSEWKTCDVRRSGPPGECLSRSLDRLYITEHLVSSRKQLLDDKFFSKEHNVCAVMCWHQCTVELLVMQHESLILFLTLWFSHIKLSTYLFVLQTWYLKLCGLLMRGVWLLSKWYLLI